MRSNDHRINYYDKILSNSKIHHTSILLLSDRCSTSTVFRNFLKRHSNSLVYSSCNLNCLLHSSCTIVSQSSFWHLLNYKTQTIVFFFINKKIINRFNIIHLYRNKRPITVIFYTYLVSSSFVTFVRFLLSLIFCFK